MSDIKAQPPRAFSAGRKYSPILISIGLAVLLLFTVRGGDGTVDWPLHGLTVGEERFSPLDAIDRGNVHRLGLAWRFDGFAQRGQVRRGNEATPLVVGGIMYVSGPWSMVYALDAKSGELLWEYDPEVSGNWIRKTCCDAVNRGVAFWNGKIYVGTLDGYMDALDATTGKRVWRTDTITDRLRSYSITGAPRIAGKNIVIGNGGAELGVRGYVSAYDLETGKLAWRFFTVPGAPEKGDEHPELTMARTTWSAESRWDIGGGGTVWDSMVYDPDLNIIYVGVGNGSPWPVWLRSPGGGDNLFLSTILALDATTGRMKWYYQTTPGDSWDYTATQHMILTDLEIEGRVRKVIMQAPKNGFFYVLDRETGELLSAEKYTRVNWAEKIDMATGRPVLTEQANYKDGAKLIWPSTAGGHNWPPMAYSPDTKLVYIPLLELPMTFSMHKNISYRPGNVNVGARVFPPRPGSKEAQGLFNSVMMAWDPVAQKRVWQSDPLPWWGGGVLATAGGLVFQGSADGRFMVFDAGDGTLLKEIETGVGIIAAPITYSIEGMQYIAVLTGFGGGIKRFLPGVAALKYDNVPQLLVFKLDGKAVPLPPLLEKAEIQPPGIARSTDPVVIARGQKIFMDNCARCHAFRGAANGYPNLWNLSENTYAMFNDIVIDGALDYGGMPNFADELNREDTQDLLNFLISDQKTLRQKLKE